MKEFIYLNGDIVESQNAHLHVTDLAILRGYGIFDFFRAIEGKPIFMEAHLDRFEASVKKMNLELSYSRNHIRENILEIIRLNPHKLLGIKLVCTGGYSEDGYTPTTPNLFMLGKPFIMASSEKRLKLMTLKYMRELPEVKTINYAVPINHLPQMRTAKADDFLYHSNGYITESSRSNVFIVKGEKIITPKQNILRGITRMNILNAAREHFEVEERGVRLQEVFEADEVFISGSTKRVTSVEYVDNQLFTSRKITDKLLNILLQKEKE
jgi:branched-chain amino acid aminotransferase